MRDGQVGRGRKNVAARQLCTGSFHPIPDHYERLTLRQADQARTDFAMIESDLEFLMQRISQLPTASDLWRIAMLIAFAATMLGGVGIEAFWRYFACNSG
jgi:hypothetical protein